MFKLLQNTLKRSQLSRYLFSKPFFNPALSH